jgi:hypothetical protein
MSDTSATAVYRGQGITCGAWRAPADGRDDPRAEVDSLTAHDDGEVRLEGEWGQSEGFGLHNGERVPNLQVEHVSNPATTRGLPADHRTNQNPLTAAVPRTSNQRSAGPARGRR